MDSEESLLRPCKSLPPPFRDHDALQNRISPHLGSISSTQGEMIQGAGTPTREIEEGAYMTQEDGVVGQEDKTLSPQKSKEPESAAVPRSKGPLNLLELPLDILKDIFKEVSIQSNGRDCELTACQGHTHERFV